MQKAGLTLISIGALVLIGYGSRGFFLNADVPLAIRIAVGVIGVGVAVLIIKVIRDRLAKKKTEKFEEVER